MTRNSEPYPPTDYPDLAAGLSAEEQAALGDLSDVSALLVSYQADEPSAEESAMLLSKLTPILRTATAQAETPAAVPVEIPVSAPEPALPRPALPLPTWLRIARAQIQLVPVGFWLAALIVAALGVAVGTAGGADWLTGAFLMLAPLLAAAGVAYAFRPETRGLRELEQISPVGTPELLYVRLGVVLAVNMALAILLFGVIGLGRGEVILWRLMLVWLGPMIGLAGLALYLSIRWNPVAGALVPLGLWAALIVFGWQQAVADLATDMSLYRGVLNWLLAQVNTSDSLLIGSALALLAGLLLMRQAGRVGTLAG